MSDIEILVTVVYIWFLGALVALLADKVHSYLTLGWWPKGYPVGTITLIIFSWLSVIIISIFITINEVVVRMKLSDK